MYFAEQKLNNPVVRALRARLVLFDSPFALFDFSLFPLFLCLPFVQIVSVLRNPRFHQVISPDAAGVARAKVLLSVLIFFVDHL